MAEILDTYETRTFIYNPALRSELYRLSDGCRPLFRHISPLSTQRGLAETQRNICYSIALIYLQKQSMSPYSGHYHGHN